MLSVKRKVQTGFEQMMHKDAFAAKDIDPEVKVHIDKEMGDAINQKPAWRFRRGEKIRGCGQPAKT